MGTIIYFAILVISLLAVSAASFLSGIIYTINSFKKCKIKGFSICKNDENNEDEKQQLND